jgi:hypothetical protein
MESISPSCRQPCVNYSARRNGQGVPVRVGQPTLLIDNLTVGGTAL